MMYGATHRLGAEFDATTGDKIAGIWVDVFKLGSVYVPTSGEARELVIDQEFVFALEANFELMASHGFAPKVQKQHTDDGYNYGDILKVRTEGEWFQAFITFKDPADRARYNLGMIEQFSPGFTTNYMRSDTGQHIGAHMFELSFVSRAHQVNLRAPQDINPGVTLGATNEVPEMDEENKEAFNAEEGYAALAARLEALEAKLAPPEDDEAPAEEDEEMSAKLAALKSKVLAQRDEIVEMRLAAYDIDEAKTASLVKLHAADATLFSALVADLPKRKVDGVQAEIGSGAAGGEDTTITLAAICAEGIKLGHDPKSAGFVGWAATNHMERLDEIVEHARNIKTEG